MADRARTSVGRGGVLGGEKEVEGEAAGWLGDGLVAVLVPPFQLSFQREMRVRTQTGLAIEWEIR